MHAQKHSQNRSMIRRIIANTTRQSATVTPNNQSFVFLRADANQLQNQLQQMRKAPTLVSTIHSARVTRQNTAMFWGNCSLSSFWAFLNTTPRTSRYSILRLHRRQPRRHEGALAASIFNIPYLKSILSSRSPDEIVVDFSCILRPGLGCTCPNPLWGFITMYNNRSKWDSADGYTIKKWGTRQPEFQLRGVHRTSVHRCRVERYAKAETRTAHRRHNWRRSRWRRLPRYCGGSYYLPPPQAQVQSQTSA